MKQLLVIGVVAVLVIGGLFVIPNGANAETQTSFGFWKVNVYLEDCQGNRQEITSPDTYGATILSFYDENDNVFSSIVFVLSAKATGSGYSYARIYKDDIESDGFLFGPSDYAFGTDYPTGYVHIPLNDGAFHEVVERTYDFDSLGDVESGTYELVLCFDGDVTYQGVLPDGSTDPEQTMQLNQEVTHTISYQDEAITCLRCDGQGGVESQTVTGDSCPYGWTKSSDFNEDCSCYTDTTYGSWSSWSDIGCSSDCHMRQKRTRDILESTLCPGFVGPPFYQKVGTDTDYRTVYDSSCCQSTEVTCYRCDGNGGTDSDTFDNSCPYGWSSSPPDCSCDTVISYNSWSSWEVQYCLGYTKYERRTRDVYTITTCPGFVGPPPRIYDHTEDEWRNSFDPLVCSGSMSFFSSSFFTLNSITDISPYEYDSRYLG